MAGLSLPGLRLDKSSAEMEETRNTFQYVVVSIDGDYANLRRIDVESEETKLVARALLPPEIREGTKLLYELMQYEIMENA